jgi:regulator of protease activity HflC (stomatin/prohibitin superfamily)
MWYLWIVLIVLFIAALAALALKVVKQYERGVLFRLGRVIGVRQAGLTVAEKGIDDRQEAPAAVTGGQGLLPSGLPVICSLTTRAGVPRAL